MVRHRAGADGRRPALAGVVARSECAGQVEEIIGRQPLIASDLINSEVLSVLRGLLARSLVGLPPPLTRYTTSSLPHGGGGWRIRQLASCVGSDRDDVEVWIEAAKVIRVGGDDLLSTTPRADHDVGVDDVGDTAGGERPPDVGGIDTI